MSDEDYPRDLEGYAGEPPHANWPNGARIAVQFVVNYEEGAERCMVTTHLSPFFPRSSTRRRTPGKDI